jgi:hypothetical protein
MKRLFPFPLGGVFLLSLSLTLLAGALAGHAGSLARADAIDGLPADPSWSYIPDASEVYVGWGMSEAGDVNGDGYGDILVGTDWRWVVDNEFDSHVYVFNGGVGGLSASPNRDLAFAGESTNWYLTHWRVSGAGDIDGDGYDDVIIGTPVYQETDPSGEAMVFRGGAAGIGSTPDWTKNDVLGCFGSSVAAAGDVNGDGYDDVLIANDNSCYLFGQTPTETVYGFYGSASGLASTANWSVDHDASDYWYFGESIDGAGDVNGDGYDDVIVGAPGYSTSSRKMYEGAVFLYYGSPAGLSATEDWSYVSDEEYGQFGGRVAGAGDVNGDGYDDVLVAGRTGNFSAIFVFLGSAAGLSQAPDWSYAPAGNEQIGVSLDTAGDVNHDGYADIVVGSQLPMEANGKQYIDGYAYVFYGWVDGLPGDPSWTVSGEGWFASAVSRAGDVNGDSLGDVLVGAPYFDHSPYNNSGAAYAYYGSDDDDDDNDDNDDNDDDDNDGACPKLS